MPFWKLISSFTWKVCGLCPDRFCFPPFLILLLATTFLTQPLCLIEKKQSHSFQHRYIAHRTQINTSLFTFQRCTFISHHSGKQAYMLPFKYRDVKCTASTQCEIYGQKSFYGLGSHVDVPFLLHPMQRKERNLGNTHSSFQRCCRKVPGMQACSREKVAHEENYNWQKFGLCRHHTEARTHQSCHGTLCCSLCLSACVVRATSLTGWTLAGASCFCFDDHFRFLPFNLVQSEAGRASGGAGLSLPKTPVIRIFDDRDKHIRQWMTALCVDLQRIDYRSGTLWPNLTQDKDPNADLMSWYLIRSIRNWFCESPVVQNASFSVWKQIVPQRTTIACHGNFPETIFSLLSNRPWNALPCSPSVQENRRKNGSSFLGHFPGCHRSCCCKRPAPCRSPSSDVLCAAGPCRTFLYHSVLRRDVCHTLTHTHMHTAHAHCTRTLHMHTAHCTLHMHTRTRTRTHTHTHTHMETVAVPSQLCVTTVPQLLPTETQKHLNLNKSGGQVTALVCLPRDVWTADWIAWNMLTMSICFRNEHTWINFIKESCSTNPDSTQHATSVHRVWWATERRGGRHRIPWTR